LKKIWSDRSWDDYLLIRINNLIKDIERNPFKGLGKPEPLKSNLSGWWSRRIDDANRIVYRADNGILEIAQCRGHYEDTK